MRKRIIGHDPREVSAVEPGWLDLERLAQVEITSEDADYPIESALIPGTGPGWRAAQPGEQTIRLLFDLEHTSKILTLQDLKIRVLAVGQPRDLLTTFIISGYLLPSAATPTAGETRAGQPRS